MRRGIGFGLLVACLGLVFPGSALGFGPLSGFGSFGEGAGELTEPGGLAVAADGSVYVADSVNNRIAVFSAAGDFVRAFGKGVSPAGGDVCTTACEAGDESGAAGAMSFPKDVAFDQEGDVYVADPGNNRIDVFSATGVFIRAFGYGVEDGAAAFQVCTATTGCQAGAEDEAAGAMISPRGVALDAAGNVYVADAGNHRIDVFSSTPAFVHAFGKEVNAGLGEPGVCTDECQAGGADGSAGTARFPTDVELLPEGSIAITDRDNNRVAVFTAAGAFVAAFGKEVDPVEGDDVCSTVCQTAELAASAGAFNDARNLAVDAAGNIYVADAGNHRVTQLTASGAFVRSFGGGVLNGEEAFQTCTAATGCMQGLVDTFPGATPGAEGVAVDCRGAVYATEKTFGFARVERFGLPGAAPPPCGAEPQPVVAQPAAPLVAQGRLPSNRFRLVRLLRNRRNGSAVLLVRVPGPGKVFLWGRGVRTVNRGAQRAKLVRVPVRPKRPLKRYLKRKGKARIRVNVAFRPTGGIARTRERPLALRRKRR